MHYAVDLGVPLPILQKQVGHIVLKQPLCTYAHLPKKWPRPIVKQPDSWQANLRTHNLQVSENGGESFMVRLPTLLTNPNKSHLKK